MGSVAVLYLGLLLILLAKESVSDTVKTIKDNKTCPAGCTQRGNCNGETRLCECRWGYTGPSCEINQMAACQQTSEDPGSCGRIWVKNCECYRACNMLYCGGSTNQNKCTHEIGYSGGGFMCWRHRDTSVAPSSQLPEGIDPADMSRGVDWYQHYPHDSDTYPTSLLAPRERWGLSNWDGQQHTLPLSACPDRCSNGRGACFKWEHEQSPKCICRKGFNGTNCGQEDPHEACWFSPSCSGRGRCVSGFCHCDFGYWGIGCHRSTAWQPEKPGQLPDMRSGSRLKIYMYDLPWHIAFPYEYDDGFFGRDPMYRAYEYFMEYFLQDNVVRTENPYEANLFYIPALLYFYIGNVRDPVPQLNTVMSYVKSNWPFYNRSGGRDHFFWMTGDRGSCHMPRWMQDEAIKVVHFGYQRVNSNWTSLDNHDYGCIQVKRDLVVPPMNMFLDILPNGTEKYYEWLVSNGGHDGNRTLLFFFAGGVGDPGEYSGGTRQALKALLEAMNPRPHDVEFVEGRTSDYRQLLSISKFCIAPYGYGWGLRLVQAIEFGCIPVIIQDGVYQAFEDFLPYEEFSVRMLLSDVKNIVELLRSYSGQQIAALRLGLAKYYRAFIWNREYGGRAYEWTLAGLQRRLEHVRGEYFHHHHHRHLRSHRWSGE